MSEFFKGIAFPWGITIPSVIDPKDDLDVIKSSVILIVMTAIEERVMRPTFGSVVPTLLFDNMDLDTIANVKQSIRDAISNWDSRVELVDVSVDANSSQGLIQISVRYKQRIDKFHDEIEVAEFSLSRDMIT